MNEAVKIGSYEDDDYYGNEKRSNIIPAQSANFQLLVPFQHVVLSANPFGIQKGVGRQVNDEEYKDGY